MFAQKTKVNDDSVYHRFTVVGTYRSPDPKEFIGVLSQREVSAEDLQPQSVTEDEASSMHPRLLQMREIG